MISFKTDSNGKVVVGILNEQIYPFGAEEPHYIVGFWYFGVKNEPHFEMMSEEDLRRADYVHEIELNPHSLDENIMQYFAQEKERVLGLKKKNEIWFEKFDARNFDRIYYVDGGHVYYDLLVLVDEPEHSRDVFKYLALPVPIFAKKKMGLEITGKEINFGKEERWDIEDYLSFDLDTTLQFYSRDEYHDLVKKEKMRKEGIELYDTFSEEEKSLLSELESKTLVLSEIKNQFGETITERYIEGSVEEGFTLVYMRCYSSEWYGMGICQCNSHPTYKEEPISLAEVLEIAKEKMLELA